jgi:valyl-tRNA synthetase|tara:strand:- start:22559 stop:25321 length:2763 start_codon:yes stop_codon:yes gene_type:complete
MDKYQPQKIEQTSYQQWEEGGHFAPQGNGTPYCIMIPPPNVTGSLHMGHAFQNSLVDALIRYKRMQGNKTLWQMGMDHAGIATQMVVQEQLAAQGTRAADIGREKFLEKAWQWKGESGGTITKQIRRLGASLYWDTERFTMDEGLSKAVLEVFVQLHEEGLIYRGERLVNWDPQLQTSLSDLEVISEEERGHLWHCRYPISGGPIDGREYLVVATTRPETMLGDTAVAVHPDDDRYRSLVGKEVELPLTDRRIPIIADHHVDPEFGTGCVKITPGHDFNDYEIGKRHDLPLINILTSGAALNENTPAKYQGLDRYDARDAIVADLDQLGLLERVQDHTLAVPRGDRSGVVVEPYLSDQWFVKIKPLAEPAIEAVENGDIEFIPKNYENVFFTWMREFEDWCISRQLWWGHRIPAWYDEDGNIYVARSEQEARQKHSLNEEVELTQDEDVLDTWFSSALWTFSTLGWPEKTDQLATFHSTDVLVTGYDIINQWVSKMIMMSLRFMGEVPFKKVYVHGLISDAHGQKMSKSKGNGLDPLDIIDGIDADALVAKRTENLMQASMTDRIAKATRKEYPDGISAFGTDALRFTFCAIASRSRTIKFDMQRVEGYRNFCNKLWNAANFVIMNTEGVEWDGEQELSLADRWITSMLQTSIDKVTAAFDSYRFDLAARSVYEFVWDEFCDWYLELSKPILNSDQSTKAQLAGTRQTLVNVLETVLRLAHPFVPFITEELWQKIAARAKMSGTIMLQMFPVADRSLVDSDSVADIDWIKNVVNGTRNIRGEMDISPAKPIPVCFSNGDSEDKRRLQENEPLLQFLIRPSSLTWLNPTEKLPISATHLVGEMEVLVPMAGLIDKEAEIVRLDKEIERKRSDLSRAEAKMGNPSFVDRAPAQVVQKERDKALDLSSALQKLQHQRSRIESL